MKKTYIAPEIGCLKLNTVSMVCTSLPTDAPQTINSEAGGVSSGSVLSKGFGGGLWDEDSYDE